MGRAMTIGWMSCLVLTTLAALPLRAADAPAKVYVVLVGIDSYPDKQILPRTHAEADAKALYDLFTNKDYLGVAPEQVKLLLGKEDKQRKSESATHANILKAIRWATKAGRDDHVLLGLFLQGAPTGERTCYFGVDSTFKDRAKNAVAAADIEHEFAKLKSLRFSAFVDINFKGFDAGKGPAPDLNLPNLYKEFLAKEGAKEDAGTPAGRIVFLANAGLRPSLELEKHGLFAHVILKGLKGGADKEGYEPDGLVTVDELLEYLDKEMPPLVLKHGKTKEQREDSYHVLGGRECHYVLAHNPAVMPKVKERLAKLAKLAEDKKLTHELAEEGQNLLNRMPKLEAHRNLRKDYQKLVDNTLGVEEFKKARQTILDGMKFSREDSLSFAAKVIQASQELREGYVKTLNQGELIGWAIRGLYQRSGEKIPKEIRERLDKIKDSKERELTVLLADVREKLGKREDLGNHKDIDIALQQMTRHLDPYTTYIDPETLERFKEDTEATFTGIGIQIRKDTIRDQLMVITPIKDSPAYKAGLKAGDVITKITRETDSLGKPLDTPEVILTKGLRIDEAVKKIKGKKGTKVKLTVDRKDVEPLQIEVTRDSVAVETVLGARRKDDDSWDFVLDHPNRIAYVRLTSFAPNSFRDLLEAMKTLNKKGINGFIFDLRFNPGGLLDSAVYISDLFIDDGVIVSIRPRAGGLAKERSYPGLHEGSLLNFPMVCLVNGGSASGSEIVSACLQDHHRAIIIGERSYGKGSVQNLQNFEGGKLKLTTASFWRPNGKNLNRSSTAGREEDEWGVTPDKGFLVKLDAKEREDLMEAQRDTEIIRSRDPLKDKPKFRDRQLDLAVDYLRKQIQIAAKAKKEKKNDDAGGE